MFLFVSVLFATIGHSPLMLAGIRAAAGSAQGWATLGVFMLLEARAKEDSGPGHTVWSLAEAVGASAARSMYSANMCKQKYL